ncbi:hypothetical protein PIB30_070661 [Stylosanthes scabra]|uniref:Uncharacterized protein n=1 Tax=Stylosanthes scabra TaxID=79078 RepID=A0ABU6SPM5_9FABA|nr:hypothetical protein [Stylosanthes scabra]
MAPWRHGVAGAGGFVTWMAEKADLLDKFEKRRTAAGRITAGAPSGSISSFTAVPVCCAVSAVLHLKLLLSAMPPLQATGSLSLTRDEGDALKYDYELYLMCELDRELGL